MTKKRAQKFDFFQIQDLINLIQRITIKQTVENK